MCVLKKLIATLALFSGLVGSALPSFAGTLHFVSDGGQNVGGEDVYPYNFNVNGSSDVTSLMCLNFNRQISLGETWAVNVMGIGLDNSAASISQRADAWIFSQMGSYTAAEVQYAVWDILDPADVNGHTGFADSANAQYLEQTGLSMAQSATLINSGFFSGFQIYAADPNNTTGWTNGLPQDFIGAAQTPEPSSFLLMGSGLMGAAGALRRKLRRA